MDGDTIAIIAGSVAGGVVLVIVMAVTIYFFCGRRKHRKKRQQPKFRQMSPPVSPVHSQPSSLGHHPDARLPKVNSTGLWMGTPGLYAGGPSQAYFIGRPVPLSSKLPGDRIVPRSSSEARLPQAVPSQGGQRIFHSQQLTPVLEVPNRNGSMDIYDVYQFKGASKSKLAETKHTKSYYEEGFKLAPRLERSKSDLGSKSRPSRSPSQHSKQASRHSRTSSNEGKRYRSNSKESHSQRSSVHGGSKSAGSFKGGHPASREASQKSVANGHSNRAFSADAELGKVSSIREEVLLKPSAISVDAKPPPPTSSVATVARVEQDPVLMNGTPGVVSAIVGDKNNISSSATDSMKLLAKNKTDDQKTIVPQSGDENNEQSALDRKNVGHQHYIYQGDVYAMSTNSSRKVSGDEEENPIVSRMKDMVIEKSRNNILYHGSLDGSNERIYEDITDAPDSTRSEPRRPKHNKKLTDPQDLSILDGIEIPPASTADGYHALNTTYSIDTGESNELDSSPAGESPKPTSPVAMRSKETSEKAKDEAEGATDDISKAGKRITDSAFEFLNTYLSDDEGTDGQVESPPMSPTS